MQPDQPPRAQPGPWSGPPPGTEPTPETPEPTEQQSHPAPEPAPQPTAPPSGGGPSPEPEVLIGEVLPPGTPLPHQPGPQPGPPHPTGPTMQPGTGGQTSSPGSARPNRADDEFVSNLGASAAMFLLFPPFALPATIDALRARAAYRQGDRALADDNAAESRRWARAAVLFGLIGWAILVCCGGSGFVLHSCGLLG